jgi:hypothetical protein
VIICDDDIIDPQERVNPSEQTHCLGWTLLGIMRLERRLLTGLNHLPQLLFLDHISLDHHLIVSHVISM